MARKRHKRYKSQEILQKLRQAEVLICQGRTVAEACREFRGDGDHVLPLYLVLDIRLLGLRSLDFQIQLTETVIHIPIIFMTGHGDIPMSVRAMKARTVDFWLSHFAIRTCWSAIRYCGWSRSKRMAATMNAHGWPTNGTSCLGPDGRPLKLIKFLFYLIFIISNKILFSDFGG